MTVVWLIRTILSVILLYDDSSHNHNSWALLLCGSGGSGEIHGTRGRDIHGYIGCSLLQMPACIVMSFIMAAIDYLGLLFLFV